MLTRTLMMAARRVGQMTAQQVVNQPRFLAPSANSLTLKFRSFADNTVDRAELAEKLLDRARTDITDEVKNNLNATLIFKVSGNNFLVEALADKPLRIELVDSPPEKVDVTLITDEATFINMAKGKTKPTTAFMSGKLKIKGNMSVAMKAEKLFKALKPKDL